MYRKALRFTLQLHQPFVIMHRPEIQIKIPLVLAGAFVWADLAGWYTGSSLALLFVTKFLFF
jgi:hypothetical protein